MSPTKRQYSLALEVLAELQPEIAAQRVPFVPGIQVVPPPAALALERVLDEIGPLPREALLLGIATDNLPVLLNLHDPTPGPLLLAADAGAGKTAFLKTTARAAALMHPPEEVQFGVLTALPDEWLGFAKLPQCVGIFSIYHNMAIDFLYSLGGWAKATKRGRQSVLLLLDDLENMERVDFDARQTLRWLLLHGPAYRVWPIVTVNVERGQQVRGWLDAFRIRLYGHIQHIPAEFGETEAALFRSLKAGVQFVLREGDGWLKFWLPPH